MHPADHFNLPPHSAKADPALIDADLARFEAIATAIDAQLRTLAAQREAALSDTSRTGRSASDRDQEVRRLNSRIRMLRAVGPQICLGRMDPAGAGEPVYIGRIGLSDDADRRLLVDWRTPAARPFFAATAADPMGLSGRRRFRWRDGRVIDYWDEALVPGAATGPATLDAESAFIASLAASRSPRMPDVLATIRADQDAAVRADARRPLIVEGGPGTGKTVVALHRAAYLVHADPRLDGRGGGVLLIGPHPGYLAYTADVLPDLGEDGARIATLADLVPVADVVTEENPAVARLKLDARMAGAIEPAVGLYEEPPTQELSLDTAWGRLEVSAAAWAEAFASAEPGTPHNESRDPIWHELIDILADRAEDLEAPEDQLRRVLYSDEELRSVFSRAWPILKPEELVADLWEVPAYLHRCAPWLTPDQAAMLRRDPSHPPTTADLPLLDAARRRLGDPRSGAAASRRAGALAEQRRYMDDVVTGILDADDDPDSSLAMLRGADLRQVLLDIDAVADADRDPLAGPFAHIIVDEAQELADAHWQMLIRRCPSLSFTIVGDRAQAREGFPESWEERLSRLGFHDMSRVSLSVNYRTPAEVMEAAEPVIHAGLPDAAVPTSVRSSGLPVRHGRIDDLDRIVADWLAAHPEGIAAVIGAPGFDPGYEAAPRVRSLSPVKAKGLEFDLVVLVDPEQFGAGITGAVDRYVAMTRTTSQLVILA